MMNTTRKMVDTDFLKVQRAELKRRLAPILDSMAELGISATIVEERRTWEAPHRMQVVVTIGKRPIAEVALSFSRPGMYVLTVYHGRNLRKYTSTTVADVIDRVRQHVLLYARPERRPDDKRDVEDR